MSENGFDIRNIHFYRCGNDFCGSRGAMRFCLHPEGEILRADIWFTDVCHEKAKPAESQDFDLTEAGFAALQGWLAARQGGERP